MPLGAGRPILRLETRVVRLEGVGGVDHDLARNRARDLSRNVADGAVGDGEDDDVGTGDGARCRGCGGRAELRRERLGGGLLLGREGDLVAGSHE